MKVFLIAISSLFAFELDQTNSKAYLESAQKILMPFKKELMGTLQKTMKEKGVPAAVDKCHLDAPQILLSKLEEVKSKNIEFGRTTHQLRNPKNAPKEWVQKYMGQFVSGERREAMVVKINDHRVGYLEPIFIQPACLNCHGEKIAPEVDVLLSKKYPKDQARGFKLGEFRGLFWLEMNPY